MEENYQRGIKKPNQVEYISKEEYQRRVKEIVHAKKDIVWWAEKYFHIVNMGTGLQLIKLYPKQREMLQFIKDNDRVITLASRQVGKSTTYTIFALWYAMYFQDKSIMICSNKLQTSVGIVQKIARAYELIPMWMKPGVVTYNKSEIAFSNGSMIRGYATGSSTARSASANCVIIDEMAFIPQNICSDFFASVMPVISSAKNTKAIIVSTPNGKENLYYELWHQANSKDAKNNKEGWKPFRIDWWETGGVRNEEWKQQQIATIGEKRWRVEFGNEFLESDSMKKLIPDDIIEKYRKQFSDFKARNINQGKELAIISEDGKKTFTFRMYQKFDPNRTYLCSSDVAEGIGKDASVLYMWDITDTSNIKMVLKFSSNTISLIEFAYVTNKICQMYNNPFLACESNGLAIGYIEQLRVTYEYENFVRMNRDNGCGIQSHVQVKSKACLWARDMLTTIGFGFELNDLNLIDEMGTFIKKDTKVQNVYAAIGDNHDDHIMALIWACWILNPENIEKYYVIGDTFTSSLGNTYPRTVASLFDCTNEEYQIIMNIPQIKEFMVYEELHRDEFNLMDKENQKNQTKAMKFLNQNVLIGDKANNNSNVVVYSQEAMIRQMNMGIPKNNDSGLIFGTGDSFNSNNSFGFMDDDFDEKMW